VPVDHSPGTGPSSAARRARTGANRTVPVGFPVGTPTESVTCARLHPSTRARGRTVEGIAPRPSQGRRGDRGLARRAPERVSRAPGLHAAQLPRCSISVAPPPGSERPGPREGAAAPSARRP
jgi:hypothetical protein